MGVRRKDMRQTAAPVQQSQSGVRAVGSKQGFPSITVSLSSLLMWSFSSAVNHIFFCETHTLIQREYRERQRWSQTQIPREQVGGNMRHKLLCFSPLPTSSGLLTIGYERGMLNWKLGTRYSTQTKSLPCLNLWTVASWMKSWAGLCGLYCTSLRRESGLQPSSWQDLRINNGLIWRADNHDR